MESVGKGKSEKRKGEEEVGEVVGRRDWEIGKKRRE